MAAKQESMQCNGRSDATAREPRSSPSTSLKVYKPYNYLPILLCVLWDHWLQTQVTIFVGKNDPVLIHIRIKQGMWKCATRHLDLNESS